MLWYFLKTMMLETKTIQTEKQVQKTKVQNPERFVQIDNQLLQFGIRHLSSPAIKMLYLVIAKYMNSEIGVKHPVEIDIPLAELRRITVGLKREYGQRISKELTASFKIPNGILINGKNYEGGLAWFDSIVRAGDQIRFRFNPLIFELILNPRHATTLYRPEIENLKSGYAIKIFQVLRGIQNRRSNWHEESRRKFTLAKLKSILGIPKFRKLDKATIEKIIEEINRSTNLRVLEVIQIPASGNAEAFEFRFKVPKKSENNSNSGGNSSGGGSKHEKEKPEAHQEMIPENLEQLTWTQQLAFNQLKEFGISQNLILGRILPVISNQSVKGFEDIFTKKLLQYFEENTPKNDADTFVKWWAYSKIFSPSGEVWQTILKQTEQFKINLEESNPTELEKRIGDSETELTVKKKSKALKLIPNFPIQKLTIS